MVFDNSDDDFVMENPVKPPPASKPKAIPEKKIPRTKAAVKSYPTSAQNDSAPPPSPPTSSTPKQAKATDKDMTLKWELTEKFIVALEKTGLGKPLRQQATLVVILFIFLIKM